MSFFGYFPETSPDDDGLYSGLVLPPDQSEFLWNLSWLSLASGIYGITRGHYNLVGVPIGVWITSINYWRAPDYGWRRYADISFVHVSLSYHLFLSLRAEYRYQYWVCLGAAITFYPLGCYLHSKKNGRWLSTLCHGMVHILGNISNVILYSGEIL